VGEAGAREERERMRLLSLARREGTRAMAQRWVMDMVHPARRNEKALIDPILDMFARKTPATFAAQIRALLARPDAAPLLGAIDCPALILCGRDDTWAPPARHEAMAAMIAGSELAVIEQCGHMAPMERPREVAAALARWHARIGARSAAAA
jgi:pimeloyl-ACP methyl ester carboxylesterase